MGLKVNLYHVMEEETGGEATGGGSPTSFTTQAAPQAAPEGTTETKEIIGKDTWYEGIEQDLYNDSSLKPFVNEEGKLDGKNIIKSYVHTKRHLGKDKVLVPGENATDEDWNETYKRLGLPENLENYTINNRNEELVDEEFSEGFKAAALESGILPRQAQKLFDWYTDQIELYDESATTEADQNYNEEFDGLKAEWGQAYDRNLNLAKQAFGHFANEDIAAKLEEKGLDGDITLLRIFANIGQAFKDETFKNNSLPMDGSKTPAEAKEEIGRVLSDFSHPYHNSSHPNHAAEVKKINDLFAIAD